MACEARVWTWGEGEETQLRITYSVRETTTFLAPSADGDSACVVRWREITRTPVDFTTGARIFISAERSLSCISHHLTQLAIQLELAQFWSVGLAEYVCDTVVHAQERRAAFVWITFEISVQRREWLENLRWQEENSAGFGAVPATDDEIDAGLRTQTFKKLERESAKYDCMICLDEFVEDTQVSQMPCHHLFHGDCIVNWLKQSNCCPICRFRVGRPVA